MFYLSKTIIRHARKGKPRPLVWGKPQKTCVLQLESPSKHQTPSIFYLCPEEIQNEGNLQSHDLIRHLNLSLLLNPSPCLLSQSPCRCFVTRCGRSSCSCPLNGKCEDRSLPSDGPHDWGVPSSPCESSCQGGEGPEISNVRKQDYVNVSLCESNPDLQQRKGHIIFLGTRQCYRAKNTFWVLQLKRILSWVTITFNIYSDIKTRDCPMLLHTSLVAFSL